MFEKINNYFDSSWNKYGEHLVAFVAFIFFAGITVRTANYFLTNPFALTKSMNLIIAIISTFAISIFSYSILKRIILFSNIKPTLTEKEFRKKALKIKKISDKRKEEKSKKKKEELFKKLKKEAQETENHKIYFDTWLEFFAFSIFIGLTYTTFFNPIKIALKAIPAQIKNIFSKNKTNIYFAWAKVLNEKKEKIVLSFSK